MSTIEERLVRLISLQDDVTHLNENGASRGELMVCQAQRDALRASIAADWQEMVEALEKAEALEEELDTWRQTGQPITKVWEDARAILARVKGEGS